MRCRIWGREAQIKTSDPAQLLFSTWRTLKSDNCPRKKQTEDKKEDKHGTPIAHLPSGNSRLLERCQKAKGHDPRQNQADHSPQHLQDADENDVIPRLAGSIHAQKFIIHSEKRQREGTGWNSAQSSKADGASRLQGLGVFRKERSDSSCWLAMKKGGSLGSRPSRADRI